MFQVSISLAFLLLLAFILCSNGLKTLCDFTSFPQNSPLLNRMGITFVTKSGALELTSNVMASSNTGGTGDTGGTGWAVYANNVTLYDSATRFAADFESIFAFEIAPPSDNCSGDGLAFFIAHADWTANLDPTFGGAGLGIFNWTAGAITSQVVAVEFDTYQNGPPFDPKYDIDTSSHHMGIDVESVYSKVTANWREDPSKSLNGTAVITYNSTTGILSSLLRYGRYGNDTLRLTLHINLTNVLPETVVVGLSASTGVCFETHRILTWSFSATVPNPTLPNQTASNQTLDAGANQRETPAATRNKMVIILVSSCSVALLIVAVAIIMAVIRPRKKKTEKLVEEEEEDAEEETDGSMLVTMNFETGPRKFSYKELAAATNDFAKEGKLGQGGFGGVYHGILWDTKEEVAVKRFSKGSSQGKKEYVAEVSVISRLRHRNLVRLIGWCHERAELLLVYEYMEGGSLDSHLFSKKDCPVLAWERRRKVVLGLASAVLYLHEEWEQCVVHRDIKLSNVMVDSEFNARLGDFGLARLTNHGFDPRTTIVAGTMGYLAPECVITGKSSTQSDVYSFGVVLLEIASGRRAIQPIGEEEVRLVEWIWELYGVGSLMTAVDERMGSEFDQQEMERTMVVGLWCVHPDPGRRPTMKQAIRVLSLQAEIPCLPQKMPVPIYVPPPTNDFNSGFTSSSNGTTATSTTVSSTESAEAALLRG